MTDRAKIANVRSMLDQQQGKSERRDRKSGRSMVPLSRSAGGSSNQLRAANDSVGLADRARADLANMEEAKLFSDRQLDLLGIIHPRSKNRDMVDAMRQLRTKLYSLKPEANFSVLVTSVLPEGGGSFVSLNLAATIAFDTAKTSMLVEANLQTPILHKLMKLIGREDAHGLLDYLERPELGIEHIVNPSGIPRMRVVPIGNHNEISAEHFTSARYKQLMLDIKERYDNRFVIVDGPSISASADARILSEICDYTVLVIPYGGVTPGTLDSIIDEIDERKLAGIVINNQPD
ncbi:CpsD/CapB family tyrosine-protein kinase [Granulosicoccus antarcticus]|uniref:Tyrosine-protein kinase YveL n=1 Tax=Granulosicoccus antarcticus IMCC3135 TaxID=1192854 RepID=A0A2Z2NU15_9GAMM|nr:CpsD/CapB family tyrosine-protein kinase [Granulosicoccus antarcticus]ASJ74976.1 Putative tyrosine-protein kinase YveL [Granulosicoccus antarcticus IMCC3135]